MSLSITQQKIKGRHEVLMVRDGHTALMTFPLDMRALANEMCLEGNDLEEEQYPALVRKYQEKRGRLARKPAQPPAPAPGSTDAVMQRLKKRIAATQDEAEAKNNQKIAAAPVEALHTPEPCIPTPTGTHWNLPISPVVGVEQEPERIVTDDPLAALLTAAREAEIVLAFRKGEFTKAKAELAEAEDAAYKAWEAFNKELRTSLPESTHVKGIAVGSDNFFEQLIRTARQMGGEVS